MNSRSISDITCSLLLGIISPFAMAELAEAVNLTSTLDFEVEGKSMWNTGDAFVFSETDFLGVQWDKTISIGPKLGFTLNGNTSGKIGLEYDFTINSGSLNINYPVEATIKYPEIVERDKNVFLKSSFMNLSGALIETFSPQARAKLELPFKLTANADGNIDPFGFDPIPFSLIPSINFDRTHTFFDLGPDNLSFSKEFGDFGSIKAKVPVINTSGSLSGEKLTSSGSDNFIELTLDVDEVVSTLIPQVPDLGGDLEIPDPFDDDPLGIIEYDLLDVDAILNAGFSQSFEFMPGLKVQYLLETGDELIVDVGDPVSFPTPEGVGESLDVTATYFLDNMLTNDTDLVLTPGVNLSVLSGKASVLGFELLDFGPVFSDGISAPIPIDVFSTQFPIEGFPMFQEMFEIDIVEGKDFGDAPDSYKTLLSSNGPRYLEGELQRLGIDWDREPDGQPTLLANGDDLSLLGGMPEALDDEDGVIFGDSWVDVIFNIQRPGSNQYQLRAWWDTDQDGCFDHLTGYDPLTETQCIGNELKIDDLLTLEPGIFTKRYDLGFNPKEDDLYSRFRLTWDPLDLDVKPFGEAFSKPDCSEEHAVEGNCVSHGEVEDYVHVPEPSSILGIFALGGLGLIQLRKKRQ